MGTCTTTRRTSQNPPRERSCGPTSSCWRNTTDSWTQSSSCKTKSSRTRKWEWKTPIKPIWISSTILRSWPATSTPRNRTPTNFLLISMTTRKGKWCLPRNISTSSLCKLLRARWFRRLIAAAGQCTAEMLQHPRSIADQAATWGIQWRRRPANQLQNRVLSQCSSIDFTKIFNRYFLSSNKKHSQL